jgi:hypothetical protein
MRVSRRQNTVPDSDGARHVMVCVHGLAGNKYDLRMFRLAMQDRFPSMEFIMSSCNEVCI